MSALGALRWARWARCTCCAMCEGGCHKEGPEAWARWARCAVCAAGLRCGCDVGRSEVLVLRLGAGC